MKSDIEIAGEARMKNILEIAKDANIDTSYVEQYGNYKAKIDLSDAIFVVNVDGYIGESTKGEIEYAKQRGKEIMYLENN